MNNSICPNCRAANALGAGFCSNCGQSFTPATNFQPQPPPSHFAPPNLPAYTNQSFSPQISSAALPPKRGNFPARLGMVFLVAAICFTVIAIARTGFYFMGFRIGYPNNTMYNQSLIVPSLSIFLTVVTFLLGLTALILRIANPNRFGMPKTSLAACLSAVVMILLQTVLIGFGVSQGIKFASYVGNSKNNNSNTSRPSASPAASNRGASNSATNNNSMPLGEYRQCSQESVTRSVMKGGSAPVTFENNSKVALSIYRLMSDSKRSQKYFDVPPGQSRTANNGISGEWFVITDLSGNCKALVEAPNTVKIN